MKETYKDRLNDFDSLLAADFIDLKKLRDISFNGVPDEFSYRSLTWKLLHKQAREEYQSLPEGQEAHWQVVERILFVFYKLNPGIKYIQGMNEVVGPLYYVFASDSQHDWRRGAEADTFYCFQHLMSEIRDFFIKTLDSSSCGIEQTMTRMYEILAELDPPLYRLVAEEQELIPQYYAFRWISLLLSQEFFLPDVIRIWDSLFADVSRFEFLLYVCVAMLTHLREELLANDFTANMKCLQNYPPVDIGDILVEATQLRERHRPSNISK